MDDDFQCQSDQLIIYHFLWPLISPMYFGIIEAKGYKKGLSANQMTNASQMGEDPPHVIAERSSREYI